MLEVLIAVEELERERALDELELDWYLWPNAQQISAEV